MDAAANHTSHAILNWDEVGSNLILTIFIVLTAIVTIGFHHTPLLPEYLPESCVLILLGVIMGAVFEFGPLDVIDKDSKHCMPDYVKFPTFTPHLFFYVLLPPVILESAYSLYDIDFATNIGTILLYAVVGTLFNTFTIGPMLYSLYHLGLMGSASLIPDVVLTIMNTTADVVPTIMNTTVTATSAVNATSYELGMVDALVFSALISAVDPVAVLAIFQETHIDRILYFLVFGESLLNDAVTVGLYHTMLEFAEEIHENPLYTPGAGSLAIAFLKLLGVGVVGLLIGLMYGLLSALITKTTGHVRVMEPLLLLGLAYMSYLTAELVRFSGIISIIGCGLLQAHYAMKNISHKSQTTVKYFTKMMGAISEAIIFLFLGMALLTDKLLFHLPFIVWTLLICLVCRFSAVFLLTAIANRRRVRSISREEQFIMAYGGLRGAVCFSLVHMLSAKVVKPRSLFLTTSLIVILFTVFVQGATIKPLMKIFHIKRSEDNKNALLLLDIHENVGDLMLAGLEQVTGVTGHFSFMNKLRSWDEKFLQRWFLCPGTEPSVLRAFRHHAIHDLYEAGGTLPGAGRGFAPMDALRHDQEETPMRPITRQERRELRRILGSSSRPMSLLRHNVEEDEEVVANPPSLSFAGAGFAAARLRRQSQMLTARRLQGAVNRQSLRNTQNFENSTFNWGADEA